MNLKEIGTDLNRRQFLTCATGTVAGVVAATALNPLIGLAQTSEPAEAVPTAPRRKIKIGQVGLGGRGSWLAGLFAQHGGYEYHAVADYFPQVVADEGKKLGVPAERCFSGLSGYKQVIESGVEALIILDVPYFYPEQAKAAMDAGLHVYMAKPVCADVPGALSIRESHKLATQKQRVFLVDYQMPTDPFNIEVTQRIVAGGIGTLQTIFLNGAAGGGGFKDPPLTKNLESRLQKLIWVNDDALGCGYIGNYDIHVVDAVLRAVGRLPVAAYGWGARFRPAPHGDAMDTTCMMFEFGDGLVWNHQSPKGATDDWFQPNGSLPRNSKEARPAPGSRIGARPLCAAGLTTSAARWKTFTKPAPCATLPRSMTPSPRETRPTPRSSARWTARWSASSVARPPRAERG